MTLAPAKNVKVAGLAPALGADSSREVDNTTTAVGSCGATISLHILIRGCVQQRGADDTTNESLPDHVISPERVEEHASPARVAVNDVPSALRAGACPPRMVQAAPQAQADS